MGLVDRPEEGFLRYSRGPGATVLFRNPPRKRRSYALCQELTFYPDGIQYGARPVAEEGMVVGYEDAGAARIGSLGHGTYYSSRAASGSRASTRVPPEDVGATTHVPPSSAARSRIEVIPTPACQSSVTSPPRRRSPPPGSYRCHGSRSGCGRCEPGRGALRWRAPLAAPCGDVAPPGLEGRMGMLAKKTSTGRRWGTRHLKRGSTEQGYLGQDRCRPRYTL